MSYIQVDALSKAYGQQTVLSNISVEWAAGEIHGVIGRNGSGKTQLFKCICGYVAPDSGTVRVAGCTIGQQAQYPKSLGMLLESPGFLPGYSGLFNLQLLAAINTRLPKKDIIAVLDRVGLSGAGRKHVGKYSLGMRQRLGIAQAIMGNPDLLILDEPFNGLDNQGVKDIRLLLSSLRSEGKTIILASHNMQDIEELCDTVCEMDGGILTQRTAPRAVEHAI